MSFEIGKALDTGEPVLLRIKDVAGSRTFIASETRFGKSHTARKIVEECFGHVSIIIIDPEGEYSSLREKYSFLIIGRDVPINFETSTLMTSTAELMAQMVLEEKISVIIDLSTTEDLESGKEYVDKFLRRFFHLQTTTKQPYLVIFEEAEDFAPESGAPGTRTCLEMAITYARRGGKRGIGVIFVGHRPAWISKGILSQCPNKAIGRIESTDMKALEDYARIPRAIVERLVPKSDSTGVVTYPGPSRGEFCFTGDWVEKAIFIKVGPVKTTHLGASPEIIPPSPKNVQSIIESFQKKVPELIQKIKPSVSTDIEAKIKTELESKFKTKIDAIQKTADEKAERKYKVEIDKLKTLNDQLSRSQTLQAPAPIKDVLEHPIVKTRMSAFGETMRGQQARDLLTKVEREPNVTREQLAAFLNTSRDTVASLVNWINTVFRATAIVGSGKPIRYKSMLQRLFLTDVGRREIDEIERLQGEITQKKMLIEELSQKKQTLETENNTLRATLRDRPKQEDVEKLQTQLSAVRLELRQKSELLEDTIRKKKQYHGLIVDIQAVLNKLPNEKEPAPSLVAEVSQEPPPLVSDPQRSTTQHSTSQQGTIQLGSSLLNLGGMAALQRNMVEFLQRFKGTFFSESELAIALGCSEDKLFHESFNSIKQFPNMEVSSSGLRVKK